MRSRMGNSRRVADAGSNQRADFIAVVPSRQILLGDGNTESIVVADEIADELMQPILENLLHAAVLDARPHRAPVALGYSLATVRAAEMIEIEHEILIAAGKRARQLIAQDEQIGDQPGFHAFPIDPMISRQRRDRAQNGSPL